MGGASSRRLQIWDVSPSSFEIVSPPHRLNNTSVLVAAGFKKANLVAISAKNNTCTTETTAFDVSNHYLIKRLICIISNSLLSKWGMHTWEVILVSGFLQLLKDVGTPVTAKSTIMACSGLPFQKAIQHDDTGITTQLLDLGQSPNVLIRAGMNEL